MTKIQEEAARRSAAAFKREKEKLAKLAAIQKDAERPNLWERFKKWIS